MQQTWYFIRHGQPQVTGHLLGHSNVALSKLGWQQLSHTVESVTSGVLVFSSPLKRCKEFAQHYAQLHGYQFELDASLKEMNFGDWDGQSYESLWQLSHKPTLGQFWQSPHLYTPPNGESLLEFRRRVEQWWHFQLHSNRNPHNVVFTHAGVIKQLAAHILQIPISNPSVFSALDIEYGKVLKVSVYYDEQDKGWAKVVF
ncbi:histidine phosphatase family protein [Pseudoalteromonas byunsanensis]|uniref:Histidine phosphatase family protein n=1 Tax=Pseudoalteromonas byunsanensis TaxID=327939 RepID=A0A1S1NC04_9GAMM|nr:histidine phosphatase family protein [Pseudoalteromonas byunsanensis]OHU97682.1 hypothetical protein BIW53_00920 [Pseudoalteromonas byunsanensis]